jgi:hypothetical protein
VQLNHSKALRFDSLRHERYFLQFVAVSTGNRSRNSARRQPRGFRISIHGWDVICRECGDELPPAFAGRPRSYCSVTCRQRAYRRRKSAAAAAKATKEAPGTAEAGDASADRGRSASAEAIVIRVRLDDPGGGPAVAPQSAQDWGSLDELVQATLLIAHRLRERQRETDAQATDAVAAEQAAQAEPRPVQDEDTAEPDANETMPSAQHGPTESDETVQGGESG